MVARARKQNYDNKLMSWVFDEDYDQYKANLRKEAKKLKERLKGKLFYISVKFFEAPKKDENGDFVLDDFGHKIMQLMRSVSGPYRNPHRANIKLDRARRKAINKDKAKLRKIYAAHA
jgi:hypothetical protein